MEPRGGSRAGDDLLGAVGRQAGNSTVIAVQGGDGSLLFYWQPIGSRQWNREQVADTTLPALSVAQVGDSSVIASQGHQGLFFYWQTIGSGQWNPEQVTGPDIISGAGGPSVAQVGNSSVIAAIGLDESLLFSGRPSALGNGTQR